MTKTRANEALAAAEAERLWRLYGFSGPEELVLEDLAFAMGVVVLEGPLDSAEARLVRKGSRGLIRIRQGIQSRGRRRFAIAHEMGHWVLHREVSQVLACVSEDMLVAYRASPEEQEANIFASGLLMPHDLFVHQARGAPALWDRIERLATYFDTSLTATAVRFVEVIDDYCALVVSERGQIKWWRVSELFSDQFKIHTRTTLPATSIAASLFAGEPHPGEPIEMPIDRWTEVDGVEGDIVEDALRLDRYGLVLSLLSLP